MKRMKSFWWSILALFLLAIITIGAYWLFRPNESIVNNKISIKEEILIGDGMHNAFTDTIFWKNRYYMIFTKSTSHLFSDKSRLVLMRSQNGKDWKEIASFSIPKQDIRDPKFAVFNDHLFIYVLKNVDFTAEPYSTAYTMSDDGVNWSKLKDISHKGWLFWRPKTMDSITWYVPAYWYEHGKSILLKSKNGIDWEVVSEIYNGDRNDETAIEFLPNGTMICTARLEGSDSWTGDPNAATFIGSATPPYAQWSGTKTKITRLDGPFLFSYKGSIFAVGRRHVGSPGFLNEIGSIWGRKRTSLYQIMENNLIFISDFPSAGDTSYASGVVKEDELSLIYYTSNPKRDYPWVLGMLMRTDLMRVNIDLQELQKLKK